MLAHVNKRNSVTTSSNASALSAQDAEAEGDPFYFPLIGQLLEHLDGISIREQYSAAEQLQRVSRGALARARSRRLMEASSQSSCTDLSIGKVSGDRFRPTMNLAMTANASEQYMHRAYEAERSSPQLDHKRPNCAMCMQNAKLRVFSAELTALA